MKNAAQQKCRPLVPMRYMLLRHCSHTIGKHALAAGVSGLVCATTDEQAVALPSSFDFMGHFLPIKLIGGEELDWLARHSTCFNCTNIVGGSCALAGH
jgi:hypothetical protein